MFGRLVIAALAAALVGGSVSAQESFFTDEEAAGFGICVLPNGLSNPACPPPGTAALANPEAFVPWGQDIGDGWQRLTAGEDRSDPSSAMFSATYGGPKGARVAIVVIAYDTSSIGADEAWRRLLAASAVATDGIAGLRASGVDDATPVPPCTRSRLVTGHDAVFREPYETAVALCQEQNAGVLLVAVVSGEMLAMDPPLAAAVLARWSLDRGGVPS